MSRGHLRHHLIQPGDGDPRHGHYTSYSNRLCRCEACRAAWAAQTRQWRHNRSAPPPDDPRHGMPSTYINYRCRCPACTDVHAEQIRARRRRGTPGVKP